MSRYLAFISYRHKERDQKVSSLLRRGLESWHLPSGSGLPEKRRVFRDTDELPTSSDLGKDIENALFDSDWLIALCSEDYIESKWCMREIEEYLKLGRKDRIIPVIISGTPDTAVPAALRDIPAAADVSDVQDRALPGKIRSAMPMLLSRMTGLEAERFSASERKFRLLVAGTAVAAVTAAALAFSFYAIKTADQIARNNKEIAAATELVRAAEAEALQERNTARMKEAGYYAEQSWKAIAEDDSTGAIELALKGLPEDLHGDEPVSAEALSALRIALNMPGKSKVSYRLWKSARTDFDIGGWMSLRDGGLFLEETEYSSFSHYLDYETGEITKAEGNIRREALDQGYSRGYYAQSGSPRRKLFYGPERQMHVDGYYPDLDFTLNGEPYYADHVAECHYSYLFLAWLAEPEEGQEPHLALFDMREQEAIKELDITGSPVSISFARSSSDLAAVVDEAGTLHIFDLVTGNERPGPEGKFSYVCYPDAGSRLCAVSGDGKAHLFDTATWKEIYVLEAPVPIRQLQYCSLRDYVLACCADGFRVYDRETGTLVTRVQTAEEPDFAVWGNYNDNLFLHDGNTIVLLFDRRAEIYTLDTEADTRTTDCLPLYRQGLENRCARAFFSQDSRYVFQQSYSGHISKWNAGTGEFLWVNVSDWEIQGNVHDDAVLSRDGSAVWRATSFMDGLEKIDASTGETLYRTAWSTKSDGHFLMPQESPDCTLALTCKEYGEISLMFDPSSGKKLWETDAWDPEKMCFSPDGHKVWGLRCDSLETEDGDDVWYTSVDARSGEIQKEKLLYEYRGSGSVQIVLDPEGTRAAICCLEFASGGETLRNGTLVLVDLEEGRVSGTAEFQAADADVLFPSSGSITLSCQDENKERQFRTVAPDGSLGDPVREDSAAGRLLAATRENTVRFAGEEAVLENTDYGGIYNCCLTRLSDGAVLVDLERKTYTKTAAAPDGSSICIYGYYWTPTVMLASDPDTLVAKARLRLKEAGDA